MYISRVLTRIRGPLFANLNRAVLYNRGEMLNNTLPRDVVYWV